MTAGGEFRFDGRQVPFQAGQTVGAALWAAGVRSWRTTRMTGRPRGLFCGIGTCFDCLVTAGGEPNQRACLLPAAPGLDIRTQPATAHPATAATAATATATATAATATAATAPTSSPPEDRSCSPSPPSGASPSVGNGGQREHERPGEAS